MRLVEHFDHVTPRERSGAVSSDRSHYQKDWALCKILKLHLGSEDYLVAFDIHDDVVVFKPESDPDAVCFYQIKTKDEGSWSLNSLIARKKGKKGTSLPSILGNLYHNRTLFSSFTESLTLVSNAGFKIAISSDKKKSPSVLTDPLTPFEKLPEKNRKRILAAIRAEHSLSGDPALDALLWFEQADLPLQGHDVFTKGKLSEFFSEVNPGGRYNVPVVYRVLIDEIRRRNDYSQKNLVFEDMQLHKSIGRTSFEGMLKVVAIDDSCDLAWSYLSGILQAEGMAFKSLETLRRAWQKVEAERTDLSAPFRTLLESLPPSLDLTHAALTPTIETALASLKGKMADALVFDDDFLRATLLMRLRDVL
jgi:hypothetical protein